MYMAARVAEEAKNHFETGRCSDSDGFSARHSSREYGYYEQFRGFRSGPVNGTMSNYMRLVLLILYFLYFSLPDYVDPINVYVENCYTCRRQAAIGRKTHRAMSTLLFA